MNKRYILITLAVFLLSCQTKKKEVKDDVQSVLPEKGLKRLVEANVLTSNELPKIEIKVENEFRFMGQFDFEILASSDEYPEDMQGKAVAAGERYIFAQVNENRSVDKLFIVQFEGFLPENDFIYNYNFSTADSIGGNRYRHNTWFYDSKKLAQENPNEEGAKTRAFLEGKGYVLEDEFMMSRFVGLASEDRKNEIIIFYLEMLNKTTGISLEEYENSISAEKAESIRNSFIGRSRKSFEIIKG
ncbi:hypothetical protein L0P88_14305 [Muricauda sp. SCSIO 64092]|uniref:hypothetical protein n=1 Tax=Allomuricauda sp. SCSIO 64092 TaxID=2908842 RepID=UPI001FF51F08|nr:hypothetical protein [Muricauda sp. SCSIO 64092]UOY05115.1 hypothetical protein L0P88_14305 [Muricauda sp. SCSIO 64092]